MSVCKDCKIRKFNCHSTCTSYIDYCKMKEQIRELKIKECEFRDYKTKRALKVRKRRAGLKT